LLAERKKKQQQQHLATEAIIDASQEAASELEREGSGIVEMRRAWLTRFDFYKVKLTRWVDNQTFPHITLTVPNGCDAKGGAELLKRKLEHWHKESVNPTPKPQKRKKLKVNNQLAEHLDPEKMHGGKLLFEDYFFQRAWDPNTLIPDDFPLESGSDHEDDRNLPPKTYDSRRWDEARWFFAANGNAEALFAAAHIFHMTLPVYLTMEVVEAISLCRMRCPPSVATIAAVYNRRLLIQIDSPISPNVITMDTIEHMLGVAIRTLETGARELAERAIAGAEPSRELVRALMSAFCTLHIQVPPFQDVEAYAAMPTRTVAEDEFLSHNEAIISTLFKVGKDLPPVGLSKRDVPNSHALYWVIRQLEDLVRRHPECTRFIALEGFHQLTALCHSAWHERYSLSATKLVYTCLFMLFVQSSIHGEDDMAIPLAIKQFLKGVQRWPFQPKWNLCEPKLIAIATPLAQLTFLQNMSIKGSCEFLKYNVHLLHERVRHVVLDRVCWLSRKDRTWLADAVFPGFGEVPELPNDEADDYDTDIEEYIMNYKHWPELQVAARHPSHPSTSSIPHMVQAAKRV